MDKTKFDLAKNFLVPFLAIVLFAGIVFAAVLSAVNVQSPLSNQNLSNSTLLNATTQSGAENTTNVTFRWLDSSGEFVLNTTIFNNTANDTRFNESFDTTQLSDGVYNLTVNASSWDGATTTTVGNNSITGITVDNTAPNVSAINSPSDGSSHKAVNITLNATVTDATIGMGSVFFNVTNSTGDEQNFTSSSNAGDSWNATLDLSTLSEGDYNITVFANDSLDNLNNTEVATITFDKTNPSISTFKKSSSTRSKITIDKTCSDSSGSGISSCSLSSSDGDVSGNEVSSLSCGNSYDITLKATDNAGNTKSNTKSFSTDSCGGGSSSSSGGASSTASHKITQVSAGDIVTFDKVQDGSGVRQIEVEVNSDAQDVKVTVSKYDEKPADVSVEKQGNVYRYLEIEESNFGDSFESATVTLEVEKSWVSNNSLDRNDIALFRFGNEAWNELETSFVEEEDENYVYEVELEGFSFFSIGEKSSEGTGSGIGEETGESEGSSDETAEEGSNTTMWIVGFVLLIIIIIAVLWWFNKKE